MGGLWDHGVLYLGLWDSIGDNGIKGSYIWDYRILWGDYGIMGSYIWHYRVLWDIMGLWGPIFGIIGFYLALWGPIYGIMGRRALWDAIKWVAKQPSFPHSLYWSHSAPHTTHRWGAEGVIGSPRTYRAPMASIVTLCPPTPRVL